MPGLLLQAWHDRARKLIHNEYFEPDFVKFRDLTRRPVPVDTLCRATGGELTRSTRYRTLQADLGYGDELRAVFRYGDSAWGAACIARSASDPPFSEAEVAFVARVCEPLTRALRMSHLLTAGVAGDGPGGLAGPPSPGVLVIADDGTVISQTDAARYWLAQLPPERAPGLDLPVSVLAAVSGARAPGAAGKQGLIRTSNGRWLRLEAARLTPSADTPSASQNHGCQTAVVIGPAAVAELSPLVLELHELTEREREITQLLLRGLPTADIAKRLFISPYTLGDHVKSIFAKLGVSSRPELTALLLDNSTPPA
jgi:DNA-binding CsgD family transcriptional regulator